MRIALLFWCVRSTALRAAGEQFAQVAVVLGLVERLVATLLQEHLEAARKGRLYLDVGPDGFRDCDSGMLFPGVYKSANAPEPDRPRAENFLWRGLHL